jgi:hypothetical protein
MLAYELGASSVIMYRETSCFPCVCAHDLALFPPYSLLEVDERGNRSGAGSTQFSLPHVQSRDSETHLGAVVQRRILSRVASDLLCLARLPPLYDSVSSRTWTSGVATATVP